MRILNSDGQEEVRFLKWRGVAQQQKWRGVAQQPEVERRGPKVERRGLSLSVAKCMWIFAPSGYTLQGEGIAFRVEPLISEWRGISTQKRLRWALKGARKVASNRREYYDGFVGGRLAAS